MTATDELRRLLDERGVEHYDGPDSTLWCKDERGYRASAWMPPSGQLSVHIWCDTPEQAIAATLDARTLQAMNDELRKKLKDEVAENIWAREFLNGIANKIKLANARSLVNYTEIISAENAKLRELVTRIWRTARLLDANEHIDGMRITDEFRASCEVAFSELGVDA